MRPTCGARLRPAQAAPVAVRRALGEGRRVGRLGGPALQPFADAARIGLQRLGRAQHEAAVVEADAHGARRRQPAADRRARSRPSFVTPYTCVCVWLHCRILALSPGIRVFTSFHTSMYGIIVRVSARPPPRCLLPRLSTAAAPQRPPPPRPCAAPLTPERWIEAATEVLVDQGIDSVRVDVLARPAGGHARQLLLALPRPRGPAAPRAAGLARARDRAADGSAWKVPSPTRANSCATSSRCPSAAARRSAPRASSWRSAPGRGATPWRGRRWTRPTAAASATSRRCSRRWVSAIAEARFRAFAALCLRGGRIADRRADRAAQRQERDRFVERLLLLPLPA